MILRNVLNLCEQYGFLLKKPLVEKYLIAPPGALLLENLKFEWLQSMINNKDYTIFYSLGQEFLDSYEYAKQACFEKLPFGFASIMNCGQQDQFTWKTSLGQHLHDNFVLHTFVLIPPLESVRSFHQWQRIRRMWWRKFSPTPGRYFTTEITGEDGDQKLEIHAKYPWGNELVEILRLADNHPLLTAEQLMNSYKRKKTKSMILSSEIDMGGMYLNVICDAYEILQLTNCERELFKFHRKLAPYKIGFSLANPHNEQATDDLTDLSKYVCKKLRANNITSLMLPNFQRATLEAQFKNFDHLGVPYTVVLSESTLKNGILYLRSRDTTIKEEVHVKELPIYVNQLFKNY